MNQSVLPYSFSVSPGKYHSSTEESCLRTTQRVHEDLCNFSVSVVGTVN